ncbi:MAG: hypothetical protein NT159_06725 [Proteobacteria bacterium]|nr:hypothetical protein [Pseudomonadota bacterium]
MPAHQAQQSHLAAVARQGLIAARAGEDFAAMTLDDRGMIRDCNRASEMLFRYRRSELVWRHVSMLLPQLAELELMQNGQPNSRLRFLCRSGRHFQAVTQDGGHFASELFLNRLNNTEHGGLSLIVRPALEAAGDGGQRK